MSESLALNRLNTVKVLAEKLGNAETILESGYAQLAKALLDVREHRDWEESYSSWGDYIKSITEKYNMGRAQLYHKVAVVKELQGVVETDDLTKMGISKASVLADAHRLHKDLPETTIEAAKNDDVTAKELKRSLAEALHIPDHEDMEWYDMNFAFYVTKEEKQELMDADKIARGIDPPVSTTLKDFMQRKEVALRFAREILGTYSESEDAPF